MSNIEELIRKAVEEGKFDNLPGKGKPLQLGINPHEDPEWRLAYHVLRGGGFTLPWIETNREIQAALEEARLVLARTWAWRQDCLAAGRPSNEVKREWNQAVSVFRQQIAGLNKCISSYNLEVPSERFQRSLLNANREIERLTAAPLSDTL